jgi:hypothetical protein
MLQQAAKPYLKGEKTDDGSMRLQSERTREDDGAELTEAGRSFELSGDAHDLQSPGKQVKNSTVTISLSGQCSILSSLILSPFF